MPTSGTLDRNVCHNELNFGRADSGLHCRVDDSCSQRTRLEPHCHYVTFKFGICLTFSIMAVALTVGVPVLLVTTYICVQRRRRIQKHRAEVSAKLAPTHYHVNNSCSTDGFASSYPLANLAPRPLNHGVNAPRKATPVTFTMQ